MAFSHEVIDDLELALSGGCNQKLLVFRVFDSHTVSGVLDRTALHRVTSTTHFRFMSIK
jgi:hypothetical protein